MAELERHEEFAALLSKGVKSLKHHPNYKIKRNRSESASLGQSYLDKIAYQIGVSSNTIKSWMGQMGLKYIPGRIDDGKLFGILWTIIKEEYMNKEWFTNVLATTSIPTITPPIPVWVASCFRKAKILRNDSSFGPPNEGEINEVISKLFDSTLSHPKPEIKEEPLMHNLPTRGSGQFIGRHQELEVIRQWIHSPSPVCLIAGWAGMGKTTIALEAAYLCIEQINRNQDWPLFKRIIWINGDWKGLSFNDFLDTIAYQLGRAEQIDKSIAEKRLVVRNVLAIYSQQQPLLLIVDSIDTAESEIYEFVMGLPQGVKVILTARENLNQKYKAGFLEINTIQLKGFEEGEASDFFSYEISRHIQTYPSSSKKTKIEQLSNIPLNVQKELILATAGNPKALSLSIAYILDNNIPVEQLIQKIRNAGYSLVELFDFLFGSTWGKCNEDTQRLWQVLCFFHRPPDEKSWATAAGLDSRRFHYAVEKLRTHALVQQNYIGDKPHYLAHQTVVTYGKQHLDADGDFEKNSRKRWSQYYIEYLDTHLKREKPQFIYWSYLLGRDLDKIKQEWPNILKVLEWASNHAEKELVMNLIIRLSHFLSRVNLPLRIQYGLEAADYAHQLNDKVSEALIRIDIIGWALMEVNKLEEAYSQIEEGLHILKATDETHQEAHDLKIWGLALKSKLFLKTDRIEEAKKILKKICNVPVVPVIKHRVLLMQGDFCLLTKNYKEAIHFYELANEKSMLYGGEKTIEAYFNLGLAYMHCDFYEKAEKMFNNLLYNQNKPNQMELIYCYYGKAQILARKRKYKEAYDLNEKVIDLIHSWEPTINIRQEVEKFHKSMNENLLKNTHIRGGI
ncbi:NACHT domain-containing protein [Priestia endophytica]|uniref:NACHT domain-containing protein n=1 Tax=Priestia endophytica TaxID=135735 RepID=UPI002E1ADE56|nr:NB-ARC domain-containing protein [Priestia endophytica]